jgi:hypothetical protein
VRLKIKRNERGRRRPDAKELPQHMAATIIDSLRDQTHETDASSSINQVNVPFNLKMFIN